MTDIYQINFVKYAFVSHIRLLSFKKIYDMARLWCNLAQWFPSSIFLVLQNEESTRSSSRLLIC